jgi:hypothetical protein
LVGLDLYYKDSLKYKANKEEKIYACNRHTNNSNTNSKNIRPPIDKDKSK